MGVRQSKRSVDITSKDGEQVATGKAAALDGKLASIEEAGVADLKAKVANGHAEGKVSADGHIAVASRDWVCLGPRPHRVRTQGVDMVGRGAGAFVGREEGGGGGLTRGLQSR